MTTSRPESQQRCFSKLPDRTNPVGLIPNVGFLLHFEREHHVACTPLERHKIQKTFQFNRRLRDGSYVVEGDVLDNLEDWKVQVAEDTQGFIERWAIVYQFFPELNGVEWKNFPDAIKAARRKTATDRAFIREVYASFLREDAPANAPSPETVTPEWAHYRWVQCEILCSLRLFGRYQGKVPEIRGKVFLEKAEHSMLDTHHLIYGSLVGAMATLDEEVREDLLLLIPDCVLIPAKALRDAC
jgi:hypothetical protein